MKRSSIHTWLMPFLSSNRSLQLSIVVCWAQNEEVYAVVPQDCVLAERAWMLRILFQKSSLRFVIIEKLSQWRNTTSLWTGSPVTLTKLLCIIMSNFDRTVAISLNPLFVEFRPKMRKSRRQDESSPRFSEGLYECIQCYFSRGRYCPTVSWSPHRIMRSRDDDSSRSFRQRFTLLLYRTLATSE